MKQLEQRVENLLGMLERQPDGVQKRSQPPVATAPTNETQAPNVDPVNEPPQPDKPPEIPAYQSSISSQEIFDPVGSGLLEDSEAAELLNDYRCNHLKSFPFIIVDTNMTADTLRHQQPFLFLSIMAAMAYKTPEKQIILGQEFLNQIGYRVVNCAHKSLEILQGLLIHTAFYHFFYQVGKQQLALMVSLCVAATQDFGLPNRWRSCAGLGKSFAEQRAVLGTYYLAVAYASHPIKILVRV